MMTALSMSGVTKRFGDRAVLDRVDLEVHAGERIAIVGDNGSGKTTLLRIAAGLSRPQTGRVYVLGVDMLRRPEQARHRLGYIPQQVNFPVPLTAGEILDFFARIKRVADNRLDEVIAELGLEAFLDKLPGQLSGGMMQRLALAVTLLAEPQLLLLDEPTVGLDRERTADLHRLLMSASRQGCAILLATHQAGDVEQFAQRVIVVDDGRLAFERNIGGEL